MRDLHEPVEQVFKHVRVGVMGATALQSPPPMPRPELATGPAKALAGAIEGSPEMSGSGLTARSTAGAC
jgi:hypothetical protein